MREASLDTSPRPSTIVASEKSRQSREENGPEAAPEQPLDHRPSRRAPRFQTAPTTTETIQPASEDKTPAEEVQALCQLLVNFRVPLSRRNAIHLVKSLSRASAPRSGGLGLHALIGLEKSLQPLCPSSEPPLSTRKPRDETVTFLYVSCPNFSEAARKEPKAAWRHLLLALSQKGSILRPLDVLPPEA